MGQLLAPGRFVLAAPALSCTHSHHAPSANALPGAGAHNAPPGPSRPTRAHPAPPSPTWNARRVIVAQCPMQSPAHAQSRRSPPARKCSPPAHAPTPATCDSWFPRPSRHYSSRSPNAADPSKMVRSPPTPARDNPTEHQPTRYRPHTAQSYPQPVPRAIEIFTTSRQPRAQSPRHPPPNTHPRPQSPKPRRHLAPITRRAPPAECSPPR